MPWARICDSFDGHPKRELLSLAADGLLMRALARSAARCTDGYVEASWIVRQARPAERRRALAELLAHGVFEQLDAGDMRDLTAAPSPGLRQAAITVTVGPFTADGYLIHDYLDYNAASGEIAERRERDRVKKAGQRQRSRLPWDALKPTPVPQGHAPLSPRVSPLKGDTGYGGGVVQPVGEDSGLSDARARSSHPVVQEALDVLASAPRLDTDAVGVEAAVLAHPDGDPVHAAAEVVTWVSGDPTFEVTNAGKLLWDALERQRRPRRGRARIAGTPLREATGQGHYVPDVGLRRLAQEHFPTVDPDVVENMGRFLRSRGREPTVEVLAADLAEFGLLTSETREDGR